MASFTSMPVQPPVRRRISAQNPNCVISVATHDFDLVVEGMATKVIDLATVRRIAEVYRVQRWEATVDEENVSLTAPYSAPSAGPPPWDLYKVTPETVYAFGTAEPYGATRWRFA